MDNSTSITPHARSGSIRAIGITTLRRWPLGEEFVPVAETLPGYEALGFTGLAVRAGTPKAICDQIEAAAIAVAKEPAFRERMTGMLAEVVGTGASAFAAFLTAERGKWGKLITELGIKAG
jgi:tripartite-type tricarboxylate transporter receptor subunit TctC